MMKTIKAKITTLAIALMISAVSAISPAGAFAASAPPDALQMQNQIRKEILKLPYYGIYDSIGFEVDGEVVTLHGAVVRPTTRSDAARRVAKLPGVDQVINKIEVLPLSRFDDTIRLRVRRSLANTAGLYRYVWHNNSAIHIIVKNGHVRLEGNVSNEGDRRLATFAVNNVPGVFSVTNNLRVARNS